MYLTSSKKTFETDIIDDQTVCGYYLVTQDEEIVFQIKASSLANAYLDVYWVDWSDYTFTFLNSITEEGCEINYETNYYDVYIAVISTEVESYAKFTVQVHDNSTYSKSDT